MRLLLSPLLVISGSAGVLLGITLLWQTEVGFWTLALGIVSIFVGLLGGRLDRVQSEGFRAIIAVGFLALGLALMYSGFREFANDEPGAAALSFVGGVAGLSAAFGWVVGLIAEERVRSGKADPFSKWAARVWRPGNSGGQ